MNNVNITNMPGMTANIKEYINKKRLNRAPSAYWFYEVRVSSRVAKIVGMYIQNIEVYEEMGIEEFFRHMLYEYDV